MKINNLFKSLCACLLVAALPMTFVACGSDEEEKQETTKGLITIAEDQKAVEVVAEQEEGQITFNTRAAWTAKVTKGTDWIELWESSQKGSGGKATVGFYMEPNNTKEARTGTIAITCATEVVEVSITQAGSTVTVLTKDDVKDLDKFWTPSEYRNNDFFRSDSKFSWIRSKQSEHFFVFWEAGFGDDPKNAAPLNGVPMAVDIDDLLKKAEQFFKTNVETLKMAELGVGKSYLDKYKMEIFLFYTPDWLATGSGYDNTIGALWVNPSTCQPVGSTIAHEIGHSFQYQVYCDKLLQGEPDDSKHGFRYGYPGSNGGCGYWEQCAQWQSYQDYPAEAVNNYHFGVWQANYHRHFEHEWMRYASYWLQYYWVQKHGVEAYGDIWRESAYPDDAIATYMKLYNNGDWEKTRAELYEYASHMATYDLDAIRQYATSSHWNEYTTKLYQAADGTYQVAYASCPAPTGFNVIPLNLPEEEGATVSVDFEGLAAGSALAADDPGDYMKSEAVAGTVSAYNNTDVKGKEGWAYGFVALLKDGTRVYGDMNTEPKATVEFTVPANTERLMLIIQGSPTEYFQCPWDEDERTDDQLPYKVKFNGTDVLGNFTIDTTAEPTDVSFTYDLTCDAATDGYELGSIDLQSNGDIRELAQAFVLQSTVLSGNTIAIANGTTATPAEGKIAFGLLQPDGSISYSYTANSGFYITAEGNQGSWGNKDPLWVEYDKDAFVIKYGHYPGCTVAGTTYTIKPCLVYTKDGKQYKATFTLNMKF